MDFNKTLISALAGVGVLAAVAATDVSQAQEAEGQNLEQACSTLTVPVIKDLPGNVMTGFLGELTGNPIKHRSAPTNRHVTVDRGSDKPEYQVLQIVTPKEVLHAGQIAWTFDKAKAEKMVADSGGALIRKEQTLDEKATSFVFERLGDAFLYNLGGMSKDKVAAVQKTGMALQSGYTSQNCKVIWNDTLIKALDAYSDKADGKRANAVKAAVKEMSGADSPLTRKYEQMTTRQVINRDVTPDLATDMYSQHAAEGVQFKDIVEESKKGTQPGESYAGPNHGDDASAPGIYFAITGKNTRTGKDKSIGKHESDPMDVRWACSDDKFNAIVGEENLAYLNRRSVSERTFDVRSAYHRLANRANVNQLVAAMGECLEFIDMRQGYTVTPFDPLNMVRTGKMSLKGVYAQKVTKP